MIWLLVGLVIGWLVGNLWGEARANGEWARALSEQALQRQLRSTVLARAAERFMLGSLAGR